MLGFHEFGTEFFFSGGVRVACGGGGKLRLTCAAGRPTEPSTNRPRRPISQAAQSRWRRPIRNDADAVATCVASLIFFFTSSSSSSCLVVSLSLSLFLPHAGDARNVYFVFFFYWLLFFFGFHLLMGFFFLAPKDNRLYWIELGYTGLCLTILGWSGLYWVGMGYNTGLSWVILNYARLF